MDKQSLGKLKMALANVSDKPQFFAYAPAATGADGKPGSVLILSKSVPIKAVDFGKHAKALLGVEVTGSPAPVYAGTVRRGKVTFIFETDVRVSKGPFDAPKGQRLLREFATKSQLSVIAKGLLSLGELEAEAEAEREAAADAADTRADVALAEEADAEEADAEEADAEPEGNAAQGATLQDYKARLTTVRAKLAQLTTATPKQRQGLAEILVQAQEDAAEGLTDAAVAGLEQIEGLCASILRAGEVADAQATRKGPPVAAFQKSRLSWQSARNLAREEVSRLADAILADAELRTLPEFGEIQARLEELPDLLTAFDLRLLETLDDLLVENDAQSRAGLIVQSRALIDEYRTELNSNALVKALDENPWIKTDVFGTLKKSLDQMSDLLN